VRMIIKFDDEIVYCCSREVPLSHWNYISSVLRGHALNTVDFLKDLSNYSFNRKTIPLTGVLSGK